MLSERLAQAPIRRTPLKRVVVPFGEWAPDLPDLGNPGCTVAENVMPHGQGFKPLPGLSVISSALDARCQGAIAAVDTSADEHLYAGDSSKLYRLVGTTFTDSSKSGGYSIAGTERWEAIRWGNTVVFTALEAPLQTVTMGGTTFADLVTSTLKPQGRHIGIVRNFVVLGYTQEAGTNYPNRIRWCAQSDPADWDQSQSTGADFQDLESSAPGASAIQRVIGREYGLIFSRKAIWRMNYIGYPDWFSIDEIQTGGIGLLASGAAIPFGRAVFFLAEDGFYVFAGDEAVPIGNAKVDRYFMDLLDQDNLHLAGGAVFPERSTVVWGLPVGGGATKADRLALYNYKFGRWSYATVEHEILYPSTSTGVDLDTDLAGEATDTDLDAALPSFDSAAYQGGASLMGIFDTAHKLNHFSGSAMTATLETAERQLMPGEKFTPVFARPLVDGGTQTVQMGSRDLQTGSNSYGSAVTPNSNGEAGLRTQNGRARYHRFRLNLSGAWADAMGVEMRGEGGGWR
tara:strand:- start:3103 stop:4644 length:1542 start_codon:yes stop_codon:yes gene_type:complete